MDVEDPEQEDRMDVNDDRGVANDCMPHMVGVECSSEIREDVATLQLATREDLCEEETEDLKEKSLNVNPLIMVEVRIGNETLKAVVDTGASYCCIRQEEYAKLKAMGNLDGELPVCQVQLITAIGKKKFKVNTQVWVELIFGNKRSRVVMFVVPGLFAPVVLGLNWLRESKLMIDCSKDLVKYVGDGTDGSESGILEGRQGGAQVEDGLDEGIECLGVLQKEVEHKRSYVKTLRGDGRDLILASNANTDKQEDGDASYADGDPLSVATLIEVNSLKTLTNVISKCDGMSDWILSKSKWREKIWK